MTQVLETVILLSVKSQIKNLKAFHLHFSFSIHIIHQLLLEIYAYKTGSSSLTTVVETEVGSVNCKYKM